VFLASEDGNNCDDSLSGVGGGRYRDTEALRPGVTLEFYATATAMLVRSC
jgi:hypothetical protein